MSDSKKYYYMRLKEDFFNSEEVALLESMPDGYLYSNILLKLYLISLKHEGRLMFNNTIPYNAQMIATLTRHQVGTVEKALVVLKDMGLIEVLDNGAIYMLNIQALIGESSSEADRKRDYRARIEAEKKSLITEDNRPRIEDGTNVPTNVGQTYTIDRDIYRDIYKNNKEKGGFTPPSVEEVREYCHERNNAIDPENFVDFYTSKGWMVGKNKMKDWKAAVRNWEKKHPKTKNKFENFNQRTYEYEDLEKKLLARG